MMPAGASLPALDGDLLAQLALLPQQAAQSVLDSIEDADVQAAGSASEEGRADLGRKCLARARALQGVLQLLDALLTDI
jgi:hypothetical protein